MDSVTPNQFNSQQQAQQFTPPQMSPNSKSKKTGNVKEILILVCIIVVAYLGLATFIVILKPTDILDKWRTCGYEAKICPSGDVVEKERIKCEFSKCPSPAYDYINNWELKKSSSDLNRVYFNPELNISFEAPRTWKFESNKYGFDLFSPNYKTHYGFEDGIDGIRAGTNITLSHRDDNNKKSKNIEEWFISNTEYLSPINFPNYKIVKIAGTNAIELIDESTTEYETKSIKEYKQYIFLHNEEVYYLKFLTYKKDSKHDFQPVFNQILSTFKFTH